MITASTANVRCDVLCCNTEVIIHYNSKRLVAHALGAAIAKLLDDAGWKGSGGRNACPQCCKATPDLLFKWKEDTSPLAKDNQ